MQYRDLEKVRKIIDEATGLEISYAYDDLVFPDYTAFIIRYDNDCENKLHCHFHKDCEPEEVKKLLRKLKDTSHQYHTSLYLGKEFELSQEGEEVSIHFQN